MAAATTEQQFEDMEAFLRVAKYTLVKHTDMHVEMKEEVSTHAQQPLKGYKTARTHSRTGHVACCMLPGHGHLHHSS